MIKKSSLIKSLILVVFTTLFSLKTEAQQDPQYTQYMYNTLSVNPGYAGQRDVLSATALYRTQWVGLDGSPKTLTFGIHSPLRNERIGLGLNIVHNLVKKYKGSIKVDSKVGEGAIFIITFPVQ